MTKRTESPIEERAFAFLWMNDRGLKPRTQGITEIRGPYYSPLGKRHLQDVLETMGNYVDALKFAGGSFSLMPRKVLVELISLCHEHNVLVSGDHWREPWEKVAISVCSSSSRWKATVG